MHLCPLPIDPLLPEIVETLLSKRRLVLCAPPGAGKTTRVPPALLDALPQGEVLVLEPRRLAAHLSAARVAEERGGALGEEVGVQVRLGSVCGPRTRLRYVTEGILLRRLLAERELPRVRAVLLDEFHERHLTSDLLLALLLDLQRGPRKDLIVAAMSATLDGSSVARYLDDCPVIESAGRSHEVTVRYLQAAPERHVAEEVRGALLRLLREEDGEAAKTGDLLVFLPGGGEIRRCEEALAEIAAARALAVLPLHGDLPLADQRRAAAPRRPGDRRRVILSTNVAETSVTIDGVTVVIDCGLARVAAHSPFSGLPTLRVQKICRAAAAQRAGRAGRTAPGLCLRLYTRHDHDSRPAFELPEIQRLDLAEPMLLLGALGQRLGDLSFLDAPPPVALSAATALLGHLGALDGTGALTQLGRRMAALPLHPRQARLVLAGADRGVGREAAIVAALLGERDLRLGQRFGGGASAAHSGPSDLLALLDVYEEAERLRFEPGRLRAAGIDAGVARTVKQLVGPHPGPPPSGEGKESAVLQAVLCAYPDRVARRRAARSSDVVLCGGGGGTLSPASVVLDSEFLVVVDVEERAGGRTLVRLASAIEPDWLLDLPGAALSEIEVATWSDERDRVEVLRRLQYEGLTLDESRVPADGQNPTHVAVLEAALLSAGPRILDDEEGFDRLRGRLAFVAARCPEAGLPPPPLDLFPRVLALLCKGRTSLREVKEAALLPAVLLASGACETDAGEAARRLGRLAPEHILLPGGRRLRVEYPPDRPPFVASRMQDFFGLPAGPAIGGGGVPLVLHLLAPNARPVQVTTDLCGFWERHYPSIRRELCRRYPRHPWPEDPQTAAPPKAPPPRKP